MGQPDMSPELSNVAHLREYHLRLLGTGAANPTKELGFGMSVTRTGVGVFRIQFAQFVGLFVGMSYMYGAVTMSDVKGQTVTRGVYDATNLRVDISLWSSAFAADELQANEFLDLVLRFKESATGV